MTPKHLHPAITNLGLVHMPPLRSTYGGLVLTCESSATDLPLVLLSVRQPSDDLDQRDSLLRESVAYLTIDDAWRLAEQLIELVLNHHQRPRNAELPTDRAYDFVSRSDVTEESL